LTNTFETLSLTDTPGRAVAAGADAARAYGEGFLGSAGYALRTLGGVLAAIVAVWAAIMLFKHVETLAVVLAGILAVAGATSLVVRNRNLARSA
jgi:hypothetical protein